jgi:hypothetical protein
MTVQTERPIRFFVFGEQEVARKDFYADKDDKENAADPMKKPDKHGEASHALV